MKIAVPEDHESERSAIREKWYAVVMETAKGALPLEVKRPRRFGTGSWMTVAYVERAEWMGEGTDGRIDFLGTMKNLQVAERLLERAAKCAGDGAK